MYFVINPFFYYLANQSDIEKYIAIEANGDRPYHMPYSKLKSLVERYISLNSHGVDENCKEKYIMYICDQLSQT